MGLGLGTFSLGLGLLTLLLCNASDTVVKESRRTLRKAFPLQLRDLSCGLSVNVVHLENAYLLGAS